MNNGTKVWILEEGHYGIHHINKEKKWFVVGKIARNEILPNGKVNDDYDYHYLLLSEDGKTKTSVLNWYCVACPDEKREGADQIYNYLKDNGIYCEDVYTNKFYEMEKGEIAVSISWGDWKHDHGWCDMLMGYIGYDRVGLVVTEEDGSDCYSADHFYSKVA
jgi:hypothetical protein